MIRLALACRQEIVTARPGGWHVSKIVLFSGCWDAIADVARKRQEDPECRQLPQAGIGVDSCTVRIEYTFGRDRRICIKSVEAKFEDDHEARWIRFCIDGACMESSQRESAHRYYVTDADLAEIAILLKQTCEA